ncbi:Z1 domain-containing protein [Mycobacterium marinum]|uniref:Z1 domain-containing protein n=1 Tax=Mycobacterium marinum TaxID=1781 RepID=UPI00035885A8|nr:Z1 domain-containing protein [Mycobacterium marinum]EPQ72833.1 DNA helicase [Mycobacterium marinum str. Europe]
MQDPTTTDFDISKYRDLPGSSPNRLGTQYARIKNSGKSVAQIEKAVDGAIKNLTENDVRSFIIYGEPQSGKTEMMICLTAALLDNGFKIIVVLVNDAVQVLDQNLNRFRRSDLAPAPKNFSEILDESIKLGDSNWVIFCKKNAHDLDKLIQKLDKQSGLVVIDDEADYASPNAKVNRAEKTRINALVEAVIGENGAYIGVTATPARLDLNETFDNDSGRWIDFPPHDHYTGQDVFFPSAEARLEGLNYLLDLMPDNRDDKVYLRLALLSFLARVAYLNHTGTHMGNYCMLVHTSGGKSDHTRDARLIAEVFATLADGDSKNFAKYVEELFKLANEYFPEFADPVVTYVLTNIDRNNVVVMNSNSSKQQASYINATDPSTLFTVAIGGNLVSRGITFDNLLTMFFTREAHRMQQDTYIQRARMFGSRGSYLEWFQLHIPTSLYWEWQRCFVFHKLSISAIRTGEGVPLWLQDNRISAVATSSIKTASVQWKSGEMYWDKFVVEDNTRAWLTSDPGEGMDRVRRLRDEVGSSLLPNYLVDFIENFLPHGDKSVVVHGIMEVTSRYASADADLIVRQKGFIGQPQLQRSQYQRAIHHIWVIANPKGEARVYYKYAPDPNDVRVRSKNLSFVGRNKKR